MNDLSCLPTPVEAAPQKRHLTVPVMVGHVQVGGGAPIVVQSMTNTDTADIDGTVAQVAALARQGSELVRITVDRDEAAAAVPHIREKLLKRGVNVPLVGDFHYIGHKLLADHPACAEALDKYRINPGNVGFKDKRDKQFSAIVEMAIKHDKAVRIGANWGSLDQELLTHLMDINAARRHWRHDSRFTNAGTEWRPHSGSESRARDFADHGLSHLRAAGRRLPRLWAHNLDGVPRTRARYSGLDFNLHARMENALCWC